MSRASKMLAIFNDVGSHGLNEQELFGIEERIAKILKESNESEGPKNKRYSRIMVNVTENGKGIIAEVKVRKNTDGFYVARYYTESSGQLVLELEEGEYTITASKGPEYSTDAKEIKIDSRCFEMDLCIHRICDMKSFGYFAGDIHHHSIYSSPVYGGDDDVIETPLMVAQSMVAAGLDFGALSDHHNVLCHDVWSKINESLPKGVNFCPIVSKEISTSNGHVISLNVDEDVIYKIPTKEERTDEYLRNEFIRVTKEIKEKCGMAQINHPMDRQRAISWNRNYDDIIGIFDTMEIWNGASPMMDKTTNGDAFSYWLYLIDNGVYLPATTGSDTHNIKADIYSTVIDCIKKDENLCKTFEKSLPIVEKWVERGQSSGCVRTYVDLYNKDVNANNIVEALKKGESFVTNGPLIIEERNDKGEHTGKINVVSRDEITKIVVFFSDKKSYDIDVKSSLENGAYNCILKVDDICKDNDYAVLCVESDEFTKAIKYIKKEK